MLDTLVSSVHGDSTGHPQEDENAKNQHSHGCLCQMDHLCNGSTFRWIKETEIGPVRMDWGMNFMTIWPSTKAMMAGRSVSAHRGSVTDESIYL